MIAKAGLGIVGLGAISVGGVALAKPSWLGMLGPMPEWHSLSEDNEFNSSNYSNKFADKLTKYLVGVTHKTGGTANDTNQAWWEWSFKRMGNKIKNSKFSTEGKDAKVKSGYSGDNPLKKVCEEAYKKEDSDFQTAPSNSHFTKEEVWKYCSPLGKEPTTIKKHGHSSETKEKTIGKTEENSLISVHDLDNSAFWEIREKEFKNPNFNVNESDKFFTKGKPGKKHIKDLCGEAYRQNKEESETSSENKATSTETKKYCSLSQLTTA